jgi:hypothetical protein
MSSTVVIDCKLVGGVIVPFFLTAAIDAGNKLIAVELSVCRRKQCYRNGILVQAANQ